jgi:NAD(P)-dependent dehydrogenase (short-subunit alcohol dehydrogenase family)
MRFKNKHIVITGGSGGIGQAIAQLLAQQGALLTLMDLKPPVAIPKNTRFMQVDITDRSSLEQAFAEVSFIDGFVHAAASLIAAPLLEMTSDALEQLVDPEKLLFTGSEPSSPDFTPSRSFFPA